MASKPKKEFYGFVRSSDFGFYCATAYCQRKTKVEGKPEFDHDIIGFAYGCCGSATFPTMFTKTTDTYPPIPNKCCMGGDVVIVCNIVSPAPYGLILR